MRQEGWRIQEWGKDPAWEAFPKPEPRAGEILVDVEACGIGLTVLNCINGDLGDDPGDLPRVPGHEFVGRVVATGPGTDDTVVGRRVVAYFYLSCGACSECLGGRDPLCERLGGVVGVATDGGYAPFAVLPARNAIPVPDDLDPVAATVVPDAVATPVHVCGARAGITPRDRVVVIGAAGGVGAHMAQVAMLHGGRVAGLDVDDDKLAQLERFGVTPVRVGNFDALDPALWPDGPPTVVIDLVGSTASLTWSASALGSGGRLVVLTTFRDRSFPFDPRTAVFRETAVLGSRYASKREVAQAAALVANGRVRPVIGMVGGPDDVPAIHDRLRSGTLFGRGAIRWN